VSAGPQVNQSQPAVGGTLQFFGNPPYPVSGYLRAGNDAGTIFTFRNSLNSADLPILVLGNGLGKPDDFVFGGVVAANATGMPGSGSLNPVADNQVGLGDTFIRYKQLVATAVQAVSVYAGPTSAYTQISTPGVSLATAVGLLDTQTSSLRLRAGNALSELEIFNVGTTPPNVTTYLRPTAALTVAQVSLGSTLRPFSHLELAPGIAGIPPLTMQAGIAPTTPVDGDVWMTAAGLFYRSGGTTIGPLAAAGAGSVAIQNAGVPVAGGPFTTLNFSAGGATNGGGGVVNIAGGGGGGVTGGGTPGTIPVWSGATALGDSLIVFENLAGENGYTLNGNFRPDSNNSHKLGQSGRRWDEIHVNNVFTNNGNPLNIKNSGAGGTIIGRGAGDVVAFAEAAAAGSGLQVKSGTIELGGADGAAGGAVVWTNAPTSNAVQYIPFIFGGVAGWIPFIH
jgi:hypothetical protein